MKRKKNKSKKTDSVSNISDLKDTNPKTYESQDLKGDNNIEVQGISAQDIIINIESQEDPQLKKHKEKLSSQINILSEEILQYATIKKKEGNDLENYLNFLPINNLLRQLESLRIKILDKSRYDELIGIEQEIADIQKQFEKFKYSKEIVQPNDKLVREEIIEKDAVENKNEKKTRYPGISPFSSDQKNLFFGRENDIRDLRNLILLRQQVLLYSKSGIGKTSLLKAGVLPTLEKEHAVLYLRFFAYNNENSISPLQSVINVLKRVKGKYLNNEINVLDQFIADSSDYEKTLWYYFKKVQFESSSNTSYILVFDQFEELFTYPHNQIIEFKDQLFELMNIDVPIDILNQLTTPDNNFSSDDLFKELQIKTVFVIRSDRLSQLNVLSDKFPNIQETFYYLKPLTENQAKKAIEYPAKSNDLGFESPCFDFSDAALGNIIKKLSNNYSQDIETTQLQIICQEIEKIAISKKGKSNNDITIEDKDLPEFGNIFLSFYKNTIEQLSAKEQGNAKKLIENQLIRNGQRISLDERICLDFITADSLKTLVDNHLLRTEINTTDGYSYEISHDTLLSPILDSRPVIFLESDKIVWQDLIDSIEFNSCIIVIGNNFPISNENRTWNDFFESPEVMERLKHYDSKNQLFRDSRRIRSRLYAENKRLSPTILHQKLSIFPVTNFLSLANDILLSVAMSQIERKHDMVNLLIKPELDPSEDNAIIFNILNEPETANCCLTHKDYSDRVLNLELPIELQAPLRESNHILLFDVNFNNIYMPLIFSLLFKTDEYSEIYSINSKKIDYEVASMFNQNFGIQFLNTTTEEFIDELTQRLYEENSLIDQEQVLNELNKIKDYPNNP